MESPVFVFKSTSGSEGIVSDKPPRSSSSSIVYCVGQQAGLLELGLQESLSLLESKQQEESSLVQLQSREARERNYTSSRARGKREEQAVYLQISISGPCAPLF